MCTENNNGDVLREISDKLELVEMAPGCRDVSVVKGRHRQVIELENDDLCEIEGVLCGAFKAKTPVLPDHRRDILEKSSHLVKNTFASLQGSKIADVINVDGSSTVHVGHVVNITEQIVLNPSRNELEYPGKLRDYSHYFYMVDRKHWLAEPCRGQVETLEKPAKYVIICHTATEEAFTQAENVLMLRLLQTFHIDSQGWADIAYNFCIGSDGNVYEGRGWSTVGSHTATYNRHSIGIAFMGCFLKHLPPKTALRKCRELIEHGVKIGAIREDYELVGHCQCRPFLSPGKRLFDEIKTWRNFNGQVVNTQACPLNL
ncbi:peptidoglycan recognition protein 1-like [Anthonomus grandis grandis]|uniref:peptidoglycan recognition protein 1-like n=1 Tax=Anthonomus grandis grandis TaxID=2921223 RepID=UPI0021661CE5|nr:peptidoglycan recognition protein 1-like [Anthonomus grandis grandis]